MKNSKKLKNIIISIALVVSLAVTGAFAYLTQHVSKKNTFTKGDVKITLEEPNWVPDTDSDGDGIKDCVTEILSNQMIAKDPTITNTGENNAYIYMMVEIPKAKKAEIIKANPDGTFVSEEKENYPLFTFENNDDWRMIEKQVGTETDAYDYYVYAYLNELAPGESATLFDEVKFANITNSFRDELLSNGCEKLNINVTGYAIQSNMYKENENGACESWTLYANQSFWSWPDKSYED